jgi:ATP sulfurylase
VQSLIAVIVSGYTWILSSIIQRRWDDADPNPHSSRNEFNSPMWIMKLRTIESKFRNLLDTMHRALQIPNLRLGDKIVLTDFSWFVGKQPAEPRQRDVDSKIEDENTPTTLRLEIANKVLLAGSDAQTFTGRHRGAKRYRSHSGFS